MSYARAILKVTLEGKVTTLANPVDVSDCDKTPSNIRDAPSLRGLAVDAGGTVYAAATGCRCIIKITPDGKVATASRAESPWSPCGVTVQGGDIFVLEHVNANSEAHEDWPPRVRKLGPDGKVTTLVAFSAGQAAPPQK